MEDMNHLFTCLNVDANKIFNKGIKKLEVILEEHGTKPEIKKVYSRISLIHSKGK